MNGNQHHTGQKSRFLAVGLLVAGLLLASCGTDTFTPPVDPDIVVDQQATQIYVDPAVTPYFEGARVFIHVVPLDTDGELIEEDIPIEVTPSSGTMDPDLYMRLGAIRIFSFIPDEQVAEISFEITVNNYPIANSPQVQVKAPCSKESPKEMDFALELAKVYSPVIYQDTGRQPSSDYITAFDFDGDWNGENNWENLDHFPLGAMIYYAMSETRTHYFLFYGLFHPRRYGTFTDNALESFENDLTGYLMVIRKDGTSYGTLELIETMAGNQFYQYTNNDYVQTGTEKITGSFLTEDETHPRLFVEARTHGVVVNAPSVFGEYLGEEGGDFRGGDGIIYRYTGLSEEPENGNDRDVGYELESLLDTLWAQRDQDGSQTPFSGLFQSAPECALPHFFSGDEFKETGGSLPWTWDDLDDEGVEAGQWFLNPAQAVNSHLLLPKPFSNQYVYNPYLGIH